MAALKFADSHNMVVFLEKPAKSDRFEQIVDFLNAHTIKYALTINPTIYTSCIEQFWATAKAKTVNGEVQLQALVDGMKVIVTESSVRIDLQLEDAEGVYCLPNAAIFEQLALMSAKTTAWNKFSSTMASAIICLAANQKFNFSKYIFDSMMKNVDSIGKFLMYPRFIQVFLDQQVGDMSTHDKIYVTSSHTKKVFENMKRVGKGISGNITPLFPTMMPSGLTTNVADEAVNEEMDDNLVRATTTASSLEAEQDSGNIAKTQSKATLNEPSSIRTSLGSGPRRQETMVDTISQTRSENVSKHSNDLLLAGVNTPQSGEDSMQLKELMDLCTNLQNRVLTLETTKTTQALEIDSLKRRLKKLVKKDNKRTHKLKRLYKVGLSAKVISSDDEDEDITLGSTHVDANTDMFGVHYLDGDEVFVENVDASVVEKVEQSEKVVETEVVAVKDVNLSVDEVTLAQALAALKKQAPTPTPIVSSQQPSQDKGKGKMVKEEPVKKFSKKDQLKLDEEFAFKLQAEEEEERFAREKAQKVQEDNIAWDDIQAKIKIDYELAQRLQQEEQEELTIEEKSKLFQQLLEKRRKHFAVYLRVAREKGITTKSLTKDYHMYLSEKHDGMEAQRLED
ncbi:hypothetical protein Tco_0144058 [Tanacetum coccineum]